MAAALSASVAIGVCMILDKRKGTMMRKSILAGVSAIAICLMVSPASAQLGGVVYDPSNFAQAVKQVAELQRQYQQLEKSYQAISHLPNAAINRVGRELSLDRLKNALPSNLQDVDNMLNGEALGAQADRYLQQNRVYKPTGTDFGANELERNAKGVANAQSLASGLYTSATSRIGALRGLEGQLSSAIDAKAVADIQARIATEQAYIQAQQLQAQSLQMWQDAQTRNEGQRREERSRQELDTLIERAKAKGG